jgi:hypothetical protein
MTSRKDILASEFYRVDGKAPGAVPPLPKHQQMAANPYRFFRGSASLFYADLVHNNLPVPDRLIQLFR